MKLVELFSNQKLIIQLIWGQQKIEFHSKVIENDGTAIYVTPYIHNNSELDINITVDSGVICNIFTTNQLTNVRYSWKQVELTTVNRSGKTVYRLKTNGYNNTGKHDDRRLHERIPADIAATITNIDNSNDVSIVLHDISDIGISFYAPQTFSPAAALVSITFTDTIDEKVYKVKLECSIVRQISTEQGHTLYGCRVIGENKDYLIYSFIKRIRFKKNIKNNRTEKPE